MGSDHENLGGHLERIEVYRELLDAAPDAVVVVDAEGQIVLINRQTESMFGYSRSELVGREVECLMPERFQLSHVGHRARFAGTPNVRPMGSALELFGRKRNGEEFPVEISLSPLATKRGVLTSASIRDISDRKQHELALRRLQEYLLNAVESIQGAFAVFDADDRVVLCNSTYRVLFGARIDGELVGKPLDVILDANIKHGAFDLSEHPAAEFRTRWIGYHKNPRGALDVRTREGRNLRIVERRTSGGGTVATIWDVTDDVEHEKELHRARALAETASSAKSEFLASMSHELRTPLNSILGFAQLLERDKKTPLSDRQRERVEHVLKGGEHLLRLIDDILDLSRIEAGGTTVSLEPVALPEVLEEVKTTLAPMAARAEIEIVIEPVSAEVPFVIADRTRFKQVLMNFGSNAIKYGRAGGSAVFCTSVSDGFVRVSVKDDGIGIAVVQQEKMFQPFHRAGQETGPIEGTGIGLAITKRLVELMHGRVGFRSAEGAGSEFWIDLPAHVSSMGEADEVEKTSPSESPSLGDANGPRSLIVYVEDNPSNIAFMEDLLGDFDGVELITAPTAEIGIELVRARRPDIVIMDINLPGMDGLEATRRLRASPETRDIPVVALSAGAMIRDADRAAAAGFYRYLTKPIKVDVLAEVLDELLRK